MTTLHLYGCVWRLHGMAPLRLIDLRSQIEGKRQRDRETEKDVTRHGLEQNPYKLKVMPQFLEAMMQ